jgi:hypothetical protein
MNFLFRVIGNGIKYTIFLFLFVCYILLCMFLSSILFMWYISLWKNTDPSNYYLLILIPFIIFVGLIVTSIQSAYKYFFPGEPDYSKLDLDKMIEEIRVDLEKQNLL